MQRVYQDAEDLQIFCDAPYQIFFPLAYGKSLGAHHTCVLIYMVEYLHPNNISSILSTFSTYFSPCVHKQYVL
jgi:hypothetical protein